MSSTTSWSSSRGRSAEGRSHILRELGFSVVEAGDDLHGDAAVVPEMWVPGTNVLRTSILASWADTLTGLLAAGAVGPRVPVTLQLDVHVYEPLAEVQQIHAVARPVKAGQSVFVAAADFTDGTGTPLAVATGLFMVAPDPELTFPPDLRPLELLAERAGRLRQPLADRAGCERRAPGTAALPLTDEGTNSSGTLNGGLLALVVEEAALSLQPGATLAMMTLRYLRPVRVGPAVATATVHSSMAEVVVHDAGREGAMAVLATTRSFGAARAAR